MVIAQLLRMSIGRSSDVEFLQREREYLWHILVAQVLRVKNLRLTLKAELDINVPRSLALFLHTSESKVSLAKL